MLRGSKKSHKKIFRTECVLEDGLVFKLRENDNGSMRHIEMQKQILESVHARGWLWS